MGRFVRETRDKFSGGMPHAGAVMEWAGNPPRIVTARVPSALNGLGFGLGIGLTNESDDMTHTPAYLLTALSATGATTTMHGVTTYDVDRGELDKSNDEELNEGDRAGVITRSVVTMQCEDKLDLDNAVLIRIAAATGKTVGELTNTVESGKTATIGRGLKVVKVWPTFTKGGVNYNLANVLIDSEFGVTLTKST